MNMHFKNTMINGEHRLYSWNGNNRQKLRGVDWCRTDPNNFEKDN